MICYSRTQGYRDIIGNCQAIANFLKEGLEKTGHFNIISKDKGVPLVAFSLKDNGQYDEFAISETLRRFGWIVPAYTMPPDAQHVTVLRVVVREDFSRSLAERLVADILKVLAELDAVPAKIAEKLVAAEERHPQKASDEVQREIAHAWKKMIADRKKTKGVC